MGSRYFSPGCRRYPTHPSSRYPDRCRAHSARCPTCLRFTGPYFHHYWIQVMPVNEVKWGSVQSAHGTDPDTWTWGGADNAYNMEKGKGCHVRLRDPVERS